MTSQDLVDGNGLGLHYICSLRNRCVSKQQGVYACHGRRTNQFDYPLWEFGATNLCIWWEYPNTRCNSSAGWVFKSSYLMLLNGTPFSWNSFIINIIPAQDSTYHSMILGSGIAKRMAAKDWSLSYPFVNNNHDWRARTSSYLTFFSQRLMQ